MHGEVRSGVIEHGLEEALVYDGAMLSSRTITLSPKDMTRLHINRLLFLVQFPQFD